MIYLYRNSRIKVRSVSAFREKWWLIRLGPMEAVAKVPFLDLDGGYKGVQLIIIHFYNILLNILYLMLLNI